ncbi:MAG: hypothetical protein JJ909_13345, partial [Roseivirga sp.]|nr:hypothetical protein [Roseivirga sp.]
MNFQKNIHPTLNKSYFCIVNIENIQLAAVISSYVCKLGEYTPVFEFPTVTISKPEEEQISIDENYPSVSRANELSIRLNNILALQGGTDYLILGGLSDDQKSYLYFSKHYNVIEIEDINDVDFLLGSFCVKSSVTICNEQDILNGLYTAIKTASTLKIDNSVDFLPKFKSRGGGLIVIESDDHVNSVIAINYTTSVDFDFVEIAKPELNEKEIRFLIENWRNTDENRFYDELRAHIYASISEIEFINFKLCTFFSFGVPYSLVIENCIPVT